MQEEEKDEWAVVGFGEDNACRVFGPFTFVECNEVKDKLIYAQEIANCDFFDYEIVPIVTKVDFAQELDWAFDYGNENKEELPIHAFLIDY